MLKDSTESTQRDSQRDNKVDNLLEVKHLKDLLLDKDKQIQQHIKEKENLTELLRNSQVLMKQEQDRVLMLEHKLEDQEVAPDQEENQEPKDSIWNRITNVFKFS